MARSRQRANQGQNTVMVFSLVIMTILFIIASLMAWSGFSGKEDLEKEITKYKDLADLRQKDLNKQKVERAVWRLAVGYQEQEDTQDLQTYGKEYAKDLEPEMKKLEDSGITWERDPKKGDLPTKPLKVQIDELKKKLKECSDGKVKEAKTAKDTTDALTLAKGILEAEKKSLLDEFAESTKKTEDRFKNIDKMYKDAMKRLEDALPDNTKSAEAIKKLEDEKAAIQAKLDATIAANKKEIEKYKEKIGQVDLTAYDRPKAKVFQVLGDTVILDVGSDDFVKPGLTFSLFSPGAYRKDAPRKGSVEVVRALTPHTCEAKITEVAAPVRDPILTGDLLYNPAWSPGLKEHVAIAGIIDLTGDGKDNTLEFVRQLEKMGIVVDDYLDFSVTPPVRKGSGMTREHTSYLIIGEKPNLDQGAPKEVDARTARKMDIRQEVDKIEKEAIEKGITTLPARRFMALVGYKIPKINTTDDYFGNPTRPAGPAAPAKPEEKKDGEMKKEEPKKEEKKEEKKDA